jgi:uracil-DNA glycosylase
MPDYTSAFTNLAACIPREEDVKRKLAEPPIEAIMACRPRLLELVTMASPHVVVCVGKLAATWVNNFRKDMQLHHGCQVIEIMHPAAILRANVAQQGLAIKKCVLAIAKACDGIIPF